MTRIGVWELGDEDAPRRMADDREFLEKHLETWIQRDPSLLGGDIQWVARQLVLPDGSRLDLLGLTKDNTCVIAELKAGQVGAVTILQALHYFLQIAGLSDVELAERIRTRGIADESVAAALEELVAESREPTRDYRLVVAGVGAGDSAEAAASVLMRYGFSIRIQVISFQLLRDSFGHRILLREVEEEGIHEESRRARRPSEDILDLAERFGVREGFERIRQELLSRGYRTFNKKSGLNFSIGSRLQCFWIKPTEARIHMGYLSFNFPALFGVDEATALADFGPNWLDLTPEEALARVREWADMIDRYRAQSAEPPALVRQEVADDERVDDEMSLQAP